MRPGCIEKGWIKIYRADMDDWIFEDPIIWRVWCVCNKLANIKDRTLTFNQYQTPIEVKRGSFVTGIFSFHEACYPKKDKHTPNPKTTERALARLETAGFLSIEKSTHYKIVSIIDFDSYQGNGQANVHSLVQSVSTGCPVGVQSVSTTKEVKKERSKEEKKKEKDLKPFLSAQPPADAPNVFAQGLFQDEPEPLVGEIVDDEPAVKPVKVKVTKKPKELKPELDQQTLNEIITSWNELLPELHTLTKISGTRKRHFEKRFFEPGAGVYDGEPPRQTVEWWRWFFAEINKMDSYMGRNGLSWKLTFDYLVSPFNVKQQREDFQIIYEKIGEPKQQAGQKLRAGCRREENNMNVLRELLEEGE